MKWENIKKYLEKDVEILRINKLLDWDNVELENSVFLLFFSTNTFSINKLNDFLEKIIKSSPLAIEIAGDHTEEIFDFLLNKLSKKETIHHIMTKKNNENDFKNVVEDFFISTWPVEESFNSWKKYSIGFFSDKSEFRLFKDILNNFLKNRKRLDFPKEIPSLKTYAYRRYE